MPPKDNTLDQGDNEYRPRDERGRLIKFPTPVPVTSAIDEVFLDQFPCDHVYVEREIVVVPDRDGYRWHLPHDVTGWCRTRRMAIATARKAVRHADPIVQYCQTIEAARRYGHTGRTLPELVRTNSHFRNLSMLWLTKLARAALGEIKCRDRLMWARVMEVALDD